MAGFTSETEVGLPTYPSRRFVRAGGLTVAEVAEQKTSLVIGEREAEVTSTFAVLVQGIVNFIATEQVSRGPMAQSLFVGGKRPSLP